MRTPVTVMLAMVAAVSMAAVRAQTPAPGSCRTFSSRENRASTDSHGGTGRVEQACAYNAGNNELACKGTLQASGSPTYTFDIVFKFASVADFVGDQTKVTLFPHAAEHKQTTAGNGVTSAIQAKYVYDGQRRLTKIAQQMNGSPVDKVMLTWDAVGRPTSADEGGEQYRYTYDDSRREAVITNVTHPATITETFDKDGNLIREVSVTPAGTTTVKWTIISTTTVCK